MADNDHPNGISMKRRDPDRDLVQRIQNGDIAAFTEIYDKYIDKIYMFCFRNIGNQQEAEDVAQDVFVEAMKSIKNFKYRSQFRTWLYQVARYHIMDYWRKMYKSKTLSLEDFLYLDLDGKKEDVDPKNMLEKERKIEQILGLLPDHYRTVLHLRFLKNYSLRDTAAEMGTTVGNVKVMQYRALKKAAAVSNQL